MLLLPLSRVTRRYGDTLALEGLSLTVPDDTYVSLLGASGSGKTTLLRLIAGFEAPDQGAIAMNGQVIDAMPPHLRDIGFVFQNFALFPHLNVADNVGFGLRHRAVSPVANAAEVNDRVRAALALVGLDGFGHRAASAISGGQRQRVALARTVVTEPRSVLLDEPLGALDANLRARMCDELRAIRERLKISFLYVTGSETEALTMGDLVAVLSDGKIVQSGPPDVLFNRPPNADAARHLNAWNIFDTRALDTTVPAPQMAVRFEQIGIATPGRAPRGHLSLPARYLAGEFNGPTALHFFRAADDSLVQVVEHLSQPRLPAMTEGDNYHLHFAPDLAREFPGAP